MQGPFSTPAMIADGLTDSRKTIALHLGYSF
jgi:hypothetical protein